MRLKLAASLCATVLATGTAQAVVIYSYTGTAGSFVYTSGDFISGNVLVDASDLTSCLLTAPGATCRSVRFNSMGDVSGLDRVTIMLDGDGTSSNFADGAFRTPGTFVAVSGSAATLSVVSRAPEPATWATLLVGFGLTGGALRRIGRRGAIRAASA